MSSGDSTKGGFRERIVRGPRLGRLSDPFETTSKRTLTAVVVVAVVLLAGCSGGGGSGGGGPGSADWCQAGATYDYANPQTGEQAKMTIEGIVEHKGRQTCKATWESSGGQGQIGRMELYFTENSEYTHVIMYDSQGNKLYDFETTPSG